MRILICNFNIYNVHNFKCCYFHKILCSPILNNPCRQFCKFFQENDKTKNLQIQQKQQLDHSSSFSIFRRLSQTPHHHDELLKQRVKGHISRAKLSIGKEDSSKCTTLGIETLKYMGKTQLFLLMIRIRCDKNENKWINLCNTIHFVNYRFPNIAVKDAYLLINAMDSLMNKLGEHEHNHPICEEFIKDGLFYNYKLEISTYKKYGNLEFRIIAIEKKSGKRVSMSPSIQVLPSLRDRMAKLLTEFDGSQQIGPLPSSLPKWILEDDGNKLQKALLYRDTLDYKVDEKPQDRKIQIEYWRGESDKEQIQIVQAFDKRMNIGDAKDLYFNFAKIPIQDAPLLLDAMQILSDDLTKQPQINQNQSSMICHQFVEGLYFNYKMGIHSCKNQQLDFQIKTIIATEADKFRIPSKLYGPVPIRVFHWLKEKMADILLVSSSSSAYNKLDQSLNIDGEMQMQGSESEATSNLLKSNYRNKEMQHFEKLPYINYYKSERNTMFVYIEMHRFKNGKKSIFLYKWLHFTAHKFVRIFVPEDAYSLVNAMDELMSKLIDKEKPPNSTIFVREREGLKYNYRFGIHLNPRHNGHLEFRMESITTAADPSHKPKELSVPIRLLPLLRDVMSKMLTQFDGTKQIELPPSPLPKWMEEEEISTLDNDMVNANEEQLEIMRQETLDFNINAIIGNQQDRKMIIRLERNKAGEEFIQIVQEFDKQLESTNLEEDKSLFVYFPPIPVKIASNLLNAMHTLSTDSEEKCAALQISDEILAKEDQKNIKELVICQQIVSGLRNDYKLQISTSHVSKQLNFELQTITTKADKTSNFKPKKLYGPIPMDVFNWLREQMAELLKSSSSNQQEQKTYHVEPLNKDVNGKEPIAYKEETNNVYEGLIRLEAEYYTVYNDPHSRLIKIELKQGKSGRKYIEIVQKYIRKDGGDQYIDFPNIVVPEDIYHMLDAMHLLSNELQEKLFSTDHLIGEDKSPINCQQIVKGLNYDYKLEIHSTKNQQLNFKLKTMAKKSNKFFEPRKLYGPIPINIFNWLKNKMAEIIADYDKSKGNEENR